MTERADVPDGSGGGGGSSDLECQVKRSLTLLKTSCSIVCLQKGEDSPPVVSKWDKGEGVAIWFQLANNRTAVTHSATQFLTS